MTKMADDKARRKQGKLRRKARTIMSALFKLLNGPLPKSKRVLKKSWAKKHGGTGTFLSRKNRAKTKK